MKPLKLLIIALLTCPVSMFADDMVTALSVLTKDNQTHIFALPEKPQVKFEGANLVVHTTKTDATFPLDNVLRFTYEKISYDGIYENQDEKPQLSYEGGTLIIQNIKAGETASIYTTDGRLVRQMTAKRTGTYRLNLAELNAGVYIIKAGNTTYKITKR